MTTVRSYRLEAFRAAAERLGVSVTTGVDLPPELADQWSGVLPLQFSRLEEAVQTIVDYATKQSLAAILAVDDSGSLLAAAASEALGLPHNRPAAALAARDKYVMRRLLRDAAVASGLSSPIAIPWFQQFTTDDDAALISGRVPYPCVVKPLDLNGSRGVMRADTPEELVAAVARLKRMILPGDDKTMRSFLIEAFVPGVEIALEGLLDGGELRVLALFDKPDPLDGPFFEETIYTTPSRLPHETQTAIATATAAAARALGLQVGPIHAELRVNDGGPWVIEIAGRSIGGLCSQVLRFGIDGSLEELILRQAAGLAPGDASQRDRAAGVMMIPIPAAGLLREVEGVEEAETVPLIVGVEITARLNYPLTPLPEGDSYLGFIFARGETPAAVELALRAAHARLRFRIDPLLPVIAG